MAESKLDYLREEKKTSLKIIQIYCIKEEIKLLVIELNLLVKKKISCL